MKRVSATGVRPRAWRYASPLVILLSLAACDDFMDAPSLDVKLPESWSQTETPAPVHPNEPPAPLARDWWKAANDPVLNQLMDKIATQNLSLEQARFRLQAARSEVAGSQYLPTLSLGQSATFEPVSVFQQRTIPGGVPSNDDIKPIFGGYHKIGLDAQWEVPLFGSYHAAAEQAQAYVALAEADIDAVHASVAAEAITDYTQLRAAQNQLATLKRIEEAQTDCVKLLGIRINAGLSDTAERTKAQQILLNIQTEIAIAQSSVVEFKQRLARLEGTATTDPALDAIGPLVIFPPMQFSDTPVDVIRNRPDIRKAEQSVIAAADELKLAKNDRYPKLTLEGELFKFDNLLAHPQPQTSPAVSFTEGLTLPLFDWGRLLAAARAKDAKLAESASAYRETVVNAITETEQMLASYRAAQTGRETATESHTHTVALADQVAILNKQGLTDKIALESAFITEQRATMETASAASNETIRLTNLTKALGGGIAQKTETPRAP